MEKGEEGTEGREVDRRVSMTDKERKRLRDSKRAGKAGRGLLSGRQLAAGSDDVTRSC